jgi:sulfopyruvate decarboxylase TPP-binding subunit
MAFGKSLPGILTLLYVPSFTYNEHEEAVDVLRIADHEAADRWGMMGLGRSAKILDIRK